MALLHVVRGYECLWVGGYVRPSSAQGRVDCRAGALGFERLRKIDWSIVVNV